MDASASPAPNSETGQLPPPNLPNDLDSKGFPMGPLDPGGVCSMGPHFVYDTQWVGKDSRLGGPYVEAQNVLDECRLSLCLYRDYLC